jgi:hypothetical protein
VAAGELAAVEAAAGAALPLAAGAVLDAVAAVGAAAVVAAGALLALEDALATVVAAPLSALWLHAASSNRAAHRIGRRLRMGTSDGCGAADTPTPGSACGMDQGVAGLAASAGCRPSM